MKKIFISVITMFLLVSCNTDHQNDKIRSFYMGFTPWPYDSTSEAVDWTYDTINQNGDIISHHMEEGIPWPEAFNCTPFSSEFQTEIDSRIERYQSDKKILLSVSPLNMSRNGIALYRGSSESMELPSPWNSYSLNSTQVKTAYRNYVKTMADSFNPDYLIIGIEVNLLIRNNPSLWAPYIELQEYVYSSMKNEYPDLMIGVSVFCVPFFPEWSAEDDLESQLSGLRELENISDFIAFSVHPFMSSLTAESLPDDYLLKLFAVTDKPVAVSESSYPGECWVTITEPVIKFDGTPAKQNSFLSGLLEESDNFNALFVIWYTVRDYDSLWEVSMNRDPIGLIWRDTGLFDGSGNSRTAFTEWKKWYGYDLSR